MAKSKLLMALDSHRGRNYKVEKQKKQQKQAAKKKKSRAPVSNHFEQSEDVKTKVNGTVPMPEAESEGWESDESEAAEPGPIDTSGLFDSESDSESSLGDQENQNLDESGPEEEEEGIPLSDIESLASEEKADLLPHQRLTINNVSALQKAHKSIALSYSTLPFSAHQSLTTSAPVEITDVNDDLTRELAFYKQCLDAANEGRALLKKEGVPFSRPNDYFAEMVKSDEHMGKIKAKMVDEAANKKAATEARRQRDLKKFGKQVQVAKLQERDKAKRETLDKINLLKRSMVPPAQTLLADSRGDGLNTDGVLERKNNTDTGTANEEDLFDVALEDAAKEDRSSRAGRDGAARGRPQNKRQKKDEKFGFGGKKRFNKSTDAASTADMRGFSAKKMKGKTGTKRLGKSRRAKM